MGVDPQGVESDVEKDYYIYMAEVIPVKGIRDNPIWRDRRDYLLSRLPIFLRRRGRHAPSWIAYGLVDELVDALTEGVVESRAAEELHMKQGL